MSFDFSTSIQSFNNEFNLNAVRDYNNYLQRQDSFQFDNDINEFSKALEVASSSVPLRDKNDSYGMGNFMDKIGSGLGGGLDAVNKAKLEAREILLSAKEDANDIIKNIESSNSNKESNQLRNKLNKKIDDLSILQDSSTNKKEISIDELSIGMNVYIRKIDQDGTILSISKDKKIGVQLTLGKMFFELSDIEIKNSKPKKQETKKDYSNRKEFKAKAISPEINLLGRNVDEACFEIDKYLDNCYLNGLESVRIVHGKGTGALRAGIHKFLKTHPHVKSFRLGTFGEGEMGVTIVELK